MTEVKKAVNKVEKQSKKKIERQPKEAKKTLYKNSVKGKKSKGGEFVASRSYVIFSIITMAAEALVIIVLGMALTTISNGPKYVIDKDGNVTKVREDKPSKYGSIVEGDHVEGKSDSEVVLVWYVDMQCPACASMAPIIQALYDKYGDRVAFVTRNFLITGHTYARPAAYAVEAAGEQGYYWPMLMEVFSKRSDWAYVNNEDVLKERLVEVFMSATDGNGDKGRFIADMTSDKYRAKIESDDKMVSGDDLSGTPTVIINGNNIDFAGGTETPLNMFTEEIEKALGGK